MENLKEHSLISQRTVHNAIRSHESIHKVPITQKMLTNVRAAHRRYEEHLKESKQKEKEENKKVEKRILSIQINKLEEQRKMLKLKALTEEDAIKSKIQMLEKKKLT